MQSNCFIAYNSWISTTQQIKLKIQSGAKIQLTTDKMFVHTLYVDSVKLLQVSRC